MDIGLSLRQLRLQRGLTQEELAFFQKLYERPENNHYIRARIPTTDQPVSEVLGQEKQKENLRRKRSQKSEFAGDFCHFFFSLPGRRGVDPYKPPFKPLLCP